MTIAYRIADALDRPFVVSGWSASYRTSHTAGLIAMDDWENVMHAQIAKVLDRPTTTTLVAFDPNEMDRVADLAGFLVFDRAGLSPLVHYCYVRGPRRKNGVARGLFRIARIDPTKPFMYTCTTATSYHVVKAGKIPLARWEPLTARYGNQNQGEQHG